MNMKTGNKAASKTLSKIYSANHQTLFELCKYMAVQNAFIVAHLQNAEIDFEEAFKQGMKQIDSIFDECKAEAAKGYRPVKV